MVNFACLPKGGGAGLNESGAGHATLWFSRVGAELTAFLYVVTGGQEVGSRVAAYAKAGVYITGCVEGGGGGLGSIVVPIYTSKGWLASSMQVRCKLWRLH